MKKSAFLICLSMLLLQMVACGDSAQTPDTQSDTATVTEAETETGYADGLPDVDYGGKEFRIYATFETGYEVEAEEETGDIENDAVYQRNRRIEERFNVDIVCDVPEIESYEAYDTLVKNVLAGDDFCDIAGLEVWNFYRATTNHAYLDWREAKYIGFDKPWWNQDINDGSTYNGKLYGLTGSLSVSYMQYINTIYFNSELGANYDISQADLYQMVYDGTWTIDNFRSLIKDIYNDVNGNNKRDKEDLYGYAIADYTGFDGWPAAFDIPITGQDENGNMTVTMMTERMTEGMQKIYSLLYDTDGATVLSPLSGWETNFSGNLLVFYQSYILKAFNTFRDMEASYSFLPMPKFDEAQESYHNQVVDGYSIWGTPVTETDLDFVSMITEAMCADTYQNVYPVFYDVALKSKYSQDADTAKMVDLIVGSGSFDISIMYGVYLDSLPYMFRDCLISKSTDIASKYAKSESSIAEKLAEINALY